MLIVEHKMLSVVIPCYNEENTIRELLVRVLLQDIVSEVIIIDDFSHDESANIIKSFIDPRISYTLNDRNMGKGAAVSIGIKLCTSRFILIQDADLEYAPEEYERLLYPMLNFGADAVFGSRFLTYEYRRVLYYSHRLGNTVLTNMSNLFTNLDLTDMETCYKLMTREVAQKLEIEERRFGVEPEITAKLAMLGASIFEVPISYRGRTYDEGKKITWKDGVRALICILKYNSPIYRRKYLRMIGNQSNS